MTRLLFLIDDLGQGGAEKVLVNLVNNLDQDKYDITVLTLFDGGINKQFLKEHVKYDSCFKRRTKGAIHFMKLLSPKKLYKWFVKEQYDVCISYLEGTTARIISGCSNPDAKLVAWIHVEQRSRKRFVFSFRSMKEANDCYKKFHRIICVSKTVADNFKSYMEHKDVMVLYNTYESAQIVEESQVPLETEVISSEGFRLLGIGRFNKVKGFDRLVKVHQRLKKDGYNVKTYILGEGSEKKAVQKHIDDENLQESFKLLGYDTNPYRYLANVDAFVCTSYAEGFSTAAVESLIVGTPVVTMLVAGMKEMLGEDNEYGIITDNDEEAFYQGVKRIISEQGLLEYYKEKAKERGQIFSTSNTVQAVDHMFESLRKS